MHLHVALMRHSDCSVYSVLHVVCGTPGMCNLALTFVKHSDLLYCLLLQVVTMCNGVL